MDIIVIGSGGWGTALSINLLKNGHNVTLWSKNPSHTAIMQETGANPRLPNIELPKSLKFTSDPTRASKKQIAVVAVPSYAVRGAVAKVAPYFDEDTIVVSASKGIESSTCMTISQVVTQVSRKTVVAISGPTHAPEVAMGQPTGCVAACADGRAAEFVQDAFINENFRVYTSRDVTGVELGGALNNIIALCAGIGDGLGYGDNTKAFLMTRGLSESAKLGTRFGADEATFAGLTGIGDLMSMCTSKHSKNREAGILIGKGYSVRDAMKEVGAVVESFYASESVEELSKKAGLSLPVMHGAYKILHEDANPILVVQDLMTRQKQHESEDVSWSR